MIRLLKHSEIDFAKWDALVDLAKGEGHWFSMSWYLNAQGEWWALVKNDYEAGLPLPITKKWKLKKMVYQPFFTRAYQLLGKARINEVLEFTKEIKVSGALSIHGVGEELENYDDTKLYQKLKIIEYKASKNTKRNLNKAIKAELVVKPITIDEFVNNFEAETAKHIRGYKSKHIKYLRTLLEASNRGGILEIFGAFNDKNLLAGSVFLKTDSNALYLAAFVTEDGKKMGASHYIVDDFIGNNAHLIELDFGGSNVESVARFYRGFGAEDYQYSVLSF